MKWQLLFVSLLLCSCTAGFCQHRSYSDIADSVYAALDKHDAKFLLPLLDDSCRISSLPKGINSRMIPLLLNKYPSVQAYKIVAITKEAGGMRIQLEVMYETGKAAYPNFLLNPQWKITELNVVKTASLNRSHLGMRLLTAPDSLTLPLLQIQGHLYVQAEADGRKGLFLLDTGSPEMIVNRSYFNDSIRLLPASGAEALNGVRGDGVLTRKMSGFTLGKMKLSNFSAFVMNTGVAGEVDGLPFLGAIGYNILRDFEWRFDLEAGKLTLIKTDDNGEYTSQQYRPSAMKYLGAIEMKKHVPVMVITVGETSYRMGIDCSVGDNIFFARHKSELLPFLTGVAPATAAQEGVPVNGIQGILTKAVIGALTFSNMPVSIETGRFAYDDTDAAAPLDGLLGLAFLQCYKTAINLKKKMVYFR